MLERGEGQDARTETRGRDAGRGEREGKVVERFKMLFGVVIVDGKGR